MSRRQAHWRIFKDAASDSMFPWHYEHIHHVNDPHFNVLAHDYGTVETFREAASEVDRLSWRECGLALDEVAFFGLELGIDAPGGMRTCALDVAGFRFLEEATAYAAELRGLPAETAMARAERDGHMVSTMDADDEDLHLPLAGATVYLYDTETTWSHDLLSWERFALPAAS